MRTTPFRPFDIMKRHLSTNLETEKYCRPSFAKDYQTGDIILNLTGYYCKFIPTYADFIRLLTQLMHKTVLFI